MPKGPFIPDAVTPDWLVVAQEAISAREAILLAPFAMRSADSAGRRSPEPAHTYRGPYQRDRDRILHSGAFRRLSDKTQVFMGEMGDYHRNRLTHTLEVSSIARTMARALRLNEDLVEALALAHDIGHPPFGHSGEEVLDECLRDHGGFNHNRQALRIFELLENPYPDFPGLNLSREVLEGQTHRVDKTASGPLAPSPLMEVQIVDVADSIAYSAHDADDGLEVGLITLDALSEVPFWHQVEQRIGPRPARLVDRQLRRAIVHELIDWQVSDVLEVTRRELAQGKYASVSDIRRAAAFVRPSREMAEQKSGLQTFLFERVYRHPDVLARRQEAQQALRTMFFALVKSPERLPPKFLRIAESDGLPRAVADYLAGMTDRFALEEHRRLAGA